MRPGACIEPSSIADLPSRESRFAHVIKHLYAPHERWDFAVPDMPARPDRDARAAGCRAVWFRTHEPSYYAACLRCREHVVADHDRYLGPTYRRALARAIAADRWGVWRDPDRPQEAFVGDDGVFVIVRHRARTTERHVATAYRVVPRGVPFAEVTPDDFVAAAVRKLRDKTSYGEEER